MLPALKDVSVPGGSSAILLLQQLYAFTVLRLLFWAISLGTQRLARVGRAVVGASYTVYLLHQSVVVALASALAWASWPPLLEILIIATVSFGVPFMIHRHFVSRHPVAAFLLNGTPIAGAGFERRGTGKLTTLAQGNQ